MADSGHRDWKALLDRRAARRIAQGRLGLVRRAAWRSADVRLTQNMERDVNLPRSEIAKLMKAYRQQVEDAVDDNAGSAGAGRATWSDRSSARAHDRARWRRERSERTVEILGWCLSPFYGYRRDE